MKSGKTRRKITIAKRGGVVMLLYLSIATLFLSPSMIKGEAISPTDMIFRYEAFSHLVDENYRPSNELLSDQTLQFEPWKLYAREMIREGRLPINNPYQGGGVPLIGNDQSALFFPTNIIFYLLPVNFASFLGALIRLTFASMGGYLFIRSHKVRWEIAFAGGIAIGLSGFNIVWLSHPHSNVSIFLPWLFLFSKRVIENRDQNRKVKLRDSMLLATLIFLQFLGGHIETSFHITLLTGVYMVFLVVRSSLPTTQWWSFVRSSIKEISRYSLPILAGTLLSMVQLLPFILYLKDSYALASRSQYIENPYGQPVGAVATWFIPNIYGNPRDDNSLSYLPTLSLREGVKLDLSIATNFNESVQGYSGFLFLILSPVALLIRKNRHTARLFLVLNIFILLITLRIPPLFGVITSLPLFDISANHRLLLGFGFFNTVLGSFVLDQLISKREVILKKIKLLSRSYLYLLPLPVLATALVLLITMPEIRYVSYSVRALAMFTLLATILFWVSILFINNRVSQRVFVVLIGLVTIFDIFLYGFNYNPTFDLENGFPQTEGINYLQQSNRDNQVLFIGMALPPNLATYYKIYEPKNYDAMQDRRFTERFHSAYQTEGPWEVINYIPSQATIRESNSKYGLAISYIAIGSSSPLKEQFVQEYKELVVYQGEDLTIAYVASLR